MLKQISVAVALSVVASASAALVCTASASPPGLADEIEGPDFQRGETEFELRWGMLDGGDEDGDWQTKGEATYAVTDRWRPGLLVEWEQEAGETEFAAVGFENVFDFTATRSWPVRFGGYVEYEWTQEGADELELKLLMERVRGPLALTLNLNGEREIGGGAEDEWEFGYAAQGVYAFTDDFGLGIQGFGDAGTDDDFGDLGDQEHYWGPLAQFELGEGSAGAFELQVGYLFGAGEAEADGQFRIKLEFEFGGERE